MRHGIELPEPADPPDAAVFMWMTKAVNGYLHTAYTVEEIANWPPVAFQILTTIMEEMAERPKDKK